MWTDNVCQIRNISRGDVGCWGNIEEFDNERISILKLVIWQFSSHFDRIITCSNRVLCVNFELRVNPVEIDNKRWQLRDRRHWINFVPISKYITTNSRREVEIRVTKSLFWIVYDVSFISNGIGHDVLIAARI